MKKRSFFVKAIVVGLILLSSCISISPEKGDTSVNGIADADKLFEKGVFQEAFNAYEKVFSGTQDSAIRSKAFFRMCESLTHLFRYGQAAQLLLDTKLPDEPSDQARVLLLKAGLFENFLQQYSYLLGREQIDDPAAASGIFKLTPDQIGIEIDKTYLALWEMRDKLTRMELKDQGYYFLIDEVDFGRYPTLFDFFILRWTNRLCENETLAADEAQALVKETLSLPATPSKIVRAAGLMDQASLIIGPKYPEAGERWRIERLGLASTLSWKSYNIDLLTQCREQAKKILLKWMQSFTAQESKAEAGFQAAVLMNLKAEYSEAVALCNGIMNDYPATHAAKNAALLKREIVFPSLSLSVKNMTPEFQKTITISTRNLAAVYFRAYKFNATALRRLEQTPTDLTRLLYGELNEGLAKEVLKNKADVQWQVETGDQGKHKPISLTVAPPVLSEGIYFLVACNENSFQEGSTLTSSCVFNVSTTILVSSQGLSRKTEQSYYNMLYNSGPARIEDSVSHYYILDSRTGKPAKDARIFAAWRRNYSDTYSLQNLAGDEHGSAALALPVELDTHQYNQYETYPLAKQGESYSYLSYQAYFGYTSPPAVEIFLQTDRPIYRPADKVQIKVTALRRTPAGYHTLAAAQKISIAAYDPNGNVIVEKELAVNNFGSADLEFEIPKGRLLGNYSLAATYSNGLFEGSGSLQFQVEEYKRPEFEVTFENPASAFTFGQNAQVSGSVKYYFGGPVAEASVKYTVTRTTYIPWYYRSWFYGGYSASGTETAAGEVKTDQAGKFTIDFVPQAGSDTPEWLIENGVPQIAEYTIKADARDAGGRTISGSRSVKAGKNSFYFIVEQEAGFFFENAPVNLKAGRLTVNDTPQEGNAAYEVYLVENPALKTWQDLNFYAESGSLQTNTPGLDFQLKDAKNVKLAAHGTISFSKEGQNAISLPALPEGAYRITITGKDTDGSEVSIKKIFLVANNRESALPINLTAVTLLEKSEYQVGDTARLLFGSGFVDGNYVLELWAGRFFITNVFIDNGKPLQVVEIPVTAEMKGGFTVRWFGVKERAVYNGEATVTVPWTEKKLSLALDPFKPKLLPGEKTSWGVIVKNNAGAPALAEVLVLMYDRSLEYYRQADVVDFASLFLPRSAPDMGLDSVFNPYVYTFALTKGPLFDQLHAPRGDSVSLPGLRTDRTWARNHKGYFYMDGGADYFVEEPSPVTATTDKDTAETGSTISAPRAEKAPNTPKGGEDHAPPPPDIKPRQAFADTAFFFPHVITGANGQSAFEFTAPEQLTSWRIRAIALTPEAEYGTVENEAVTQKDLMVRLDLPRYFREKDLGTVTAIVHNESDQVMSGRLTIDVRENDASIINLLKLSGPEKQFSVQPHSLISFDWAVAIPAGVTAYTVEATAVSDTLSDAERRVLPILPSRERLIESAFAIIKGNNNVKLDFHAKSDPTRITEQAVLEIDPQLTLSIMNSLPLLIDYPYSCVEQTLNRYLPLAVVNEIYRKDPLVAAAIAKIPKRDTTTPPWEENDPRRDLTIAETPWGWEAQGRPSIYPIIDLFDPSNVASLKESTFNLLKQSQLSGGGFPWWPGGRPDLYMTLYVLGGLAEARRYGVDVDRDLIDRALAFVAAETPLHLKVNGDDLALVSYAAFVCTSFPEKDFPNAGSLREQAKTWTAILEKNIYALTPLGKAYLAHTYFALGDKKRADEVLAMAMDGSREDPIAGLYWTPEEYSWIWYSDTVEKHAFFLKTLLEFHPDDKRIDGMAQWLLFNRKGNVWKSTKASAAAIFTLLDYLKAHGALLSDEKFTIDWGTTKQTLSVKGDEWQKEPIRLMQTQVTPQEAPLSVSIGKEGAGTSFASLTWTYSTDELPEASKSGLMEVSRTFYVREKEGDSYHLKALVSGDTVKVGDQIVVRLKINTKSQFEYMHVKDPKASGFEAETLLSGWKYYPLWYYEEPRDSTTNFFVDWLPHGEYQLEYRLRPTKPGEYRIGAATLQSMYAPEFAAHSAGFVIKVAK